MLLKKIKSLILLTLCFLFPTTLLAEKSIYIPTFTGTIRGRYEYLTNQNLGAFKVKTLRVGAEGYIAPIMSYRAVIDLSEWGHLSLIDAYIRANPLKGFNVSLGQLRAPFTLSAHRLICEQYFVNRNFVAKNGGFRDIGLSAGYDIPKIPLTVQASVFNCSGIAERKEFWTKTYGFSTKLISAFHPNWYVTASTARHKRGDARVQMWDVGGYFDNGLWHIEAEYLRKNYVHHDFAPVNACDFFVYRNFPIEKKLIGGISGAVRYDYMSDHSSGIENEQGKLTIDDPARHRLTLGTTLSFKSKFQADIRLNYEKYFFKKGVVLTTKDDDRIVLEVIAHF